jgi:hypothetical protein
VPALRPTDDIDFPDLFAAKRNDETAS